MVDSIKNTLMRRDGISGTEADEMIMDAAQDMRERLADGEMPFDICEDHFGLESDYLEELIDIIV